MNTLRWPSLLPGANAAIHPVRKFYIDTTLSSNYGVENPLGELRFPVIEALLAIAAQ
jgi:hypothetical protein